MILASSIQKRGQALLFVFFLLIILGILGGALLNMWQAEIKTRSAERDGMMAFYLAQAGIEEAKIWARNNPGANLTSGWITLGGGRYRYIVFGATRRLSSIGQALDVSGNVIAERQIAVQVEVGYTEQEACTWQET